MPELSRFFGIVIRMYLEAGERHKIPHFHAYYQEFSAVFSIDKAEIMAGSLPRKHRRLVEAWAEIHYSELTEAWDMLQSGSKPDRIEPLK